MAYKTDWLLCLALLACTTAYAAATTKPVNKPAATAKTSNTPSRRVMYKFRDEAGTLVIKDYLPPDVVAKGYSIVNEYGQTLEEVAPAKTREQLAEEKVQKARHEVELKAQKAAAKHDAELMRQFTSVDDIIRARDTQLAAIDVQISIRSGQNVLLTTQMEERQRHAADFERKGTAIPPQLTKDISESQRQMKDNQTFIETQNHEKEKIAERFKLDIVRFKELQAQRIVRSHEAEYSALPNTSFYSCNAEDQCRKAWQLSQVFARDNATRPLEIVTESLILTGKANIDTDIALAFSKVPGKDGGAQIILEVSCAKTDAGQQICAGDKVRQIQASFPDYLGNRLQ